MSNADNLNVISIEEAEAAVEHPTPPHTSSFNGDPDSTWEYWTLRDPSDIPEEWVWERLRLRRDALLAASDFRVVADAPWDTAPWIAYRNALRDLPASTTDPRAAAWPELPE